MSTDYEKHAAEYRQKMAKVNASLDDCGIGHGVRDRMGSHIGAAADFVGRITRGIMGQLTYDHLHNVPMGTIRACDLTVDHAILGGTVHAVGAFLKWDIGAAMEFAADVLDDVNAHPEAAIVRSGSMTDMVAALVELSGWMREHTGPADGTQEMLTRAVAALDKLPKV